MRKRNNKPEPDEDDIITEQIPYHGTLAELETRLETFMAMTGCPIAMDYLPGGVHIWINNCQLKKGAKQAAEKVRRKLREENHEQ